MIRTGVVASLIVWREWIGGLNEPISIYISESGLLAIGPWQPAEEMIEGTVFHHHHDYMINARFLRFRQDLIPWCSRKELAADAKTGGRRGASP